MLWALGWLDDSGGPTLDWNDWVSLGGGGDMEGGKRGELVMSGSGLCCKMCSSRSESRGSYAVTAHTKL